MTGLVRGAAALAAAAVLVSVGATIAAAEDTPPPADWMATVYASRPQTTLSQMVLPGTHDSGSFAIDADPPCSLKVIAGTDKSTASALTGNPCLGAGLTRAQSRSLGQQLADGIRYLDLRVGVPADKVVSKKRAGKKLTNAQAAKVPLVLQHTAVSQRLTAALGDVVRFAAAHPKEQVILDFQHVDLTGTKAIDRFYTTALDKVLRTYKVDGATVCSRAWTTKVVPVADTDLGTKVTLEQAWASGRNLLVLTAKGELPSNPCYRSREKALWSPWPNTQDPTQSVAANRGYLAERQSALSGQGACVRPDGNRCGLFVDQLQLSIQSSTQLSCVLGTQTTDCSLADYARKVNDQVVAELTAWRFDEGLPVNIAIVDFYEDSAPAYAAGLIAMNQRIAAGG